MAGKEIIVMKVITAILGGKRRDYVFLTAILKQRKIMFRWEFPEGGTFSCREQRFKLNTVQTARDFLQTHGKDWKDTQSDSQEDYSTSGATGGN